MTDLPKTKPRKKRRSSTPCGFEHEDHCHPWYVTRIGSNYKHCDEERTVVNVSADGEPVGDALAHRNRHVDVSVHAVMASKVVFDL